MPDEAQSPAAIEAPSEETAAQVPAAPEPRAPAAETAPSAAPKVEEPDYDSLLSREDVIERLLQHPKAKERLKSVRESDIDRRAAEKAAQQVDTLLRQRDAQYAEQRQQEKYVEGLRQELRLIDEDPTNPLAQHRRPQIEAELRRHEDVATHQRLLSDPKVREYFNAEAGKWWKQMLAAQVQADEGLTDEERQGLDPRDPKWATPDDFFKAWRKASTSNEAKKIAKELAKVEAEAIVQERLGQQRGKQPGVVNLPPAEPAQDDSAFLAEYAAGRTNDHTRARKLMGL